MSISNRREKEKRQRRNEILNASESLFFDRMYDDVSMNHIASKVDLNKSTLYLYFANKEELFFAVVLRGTRILNSMIKKRVELVETGIEKVASFRKAYHEFTINYPDYIHIYNYFQSGRFDITNVAESESLKEIMELRKERFNVMFKSLELGITDNSIRTDVEPVEAAILLSSISKGLSEIPPDHEKILENNGINHEKFVMDVEDLILHMLMNNKA